MPPHYLGSKLRRAETNNNCFKLTQYYKDGIILVLQVHSNQHAGRNRSKQENESGDWAFRLTAQHSTRKTLKHLTWKSQSFFTISEQKQFGMIKGAESRTWARASSNMTEFWFCEVQNRRRKCSCLARQIK